MITNEELHTLLDERRKELGYSHMHLGKLAFGREDASALHNLKRGSSPTYERLAAIAEALGYEVYVGEPRTGWLNDEKLPTIVAPRLGPGWHRIPWHYLMRRKGSAPVALEASWLEHRGIDMDRLRAVEVGDSVALIQEYQNGDPVRPTTWAVYRQGEISLEHMQVGADAILLFPRHDAQVEVYAGKRMDELRPMGRVLWMNSPELFQT